ncbi:MAG: hypothetical protein QOD77_1846 [Thermoplasmata archaeon]|nr:hypothetical protein [Thermoplasmata archaeon]
MAVAAALLLAGCLGSVDDGSQAPPPDACADGVPPCVRNADAELLEAKYGFRQLSNGTGRPLQPWVTNGFAGWSVFYSDASPRVDLAARTLAEDDDDGAARGLTLAAGGKVAYTLTPLANDALDHAHARLLLQDAATGEATPLVEDRGLYPRAFGPPWLLLQEDKGDGAPRDLWALHVETRALQLVSDRSGEAHGGPVVTGHAVAGHHAVWAEAEPQPDGSFAYSVRTRDLEAQADGPTFRVAGGGEVDWIASTGAAAAILVGHDAGADLLLFDPATGQARPLGPEPGWNAVLAAAGGGAVVVAERRGDDEARLRLIRADGTSEALADLEELAVASMATDGHDLVLVAYASPSRGLRYEGTQVYWKPLDLGNRA